MSAEESPNPTSKTKRLRSRTAAASSEHDLSESDSHGKVDKNRMTRIAVKFTKQELDLLISLASDQLFRREFIDPRLPGHRANPAELNLAKQLVARLRLTTADQGQRMPLAKRNGAAN